MEFEREVNQNRPPGRFLVSNVIICYKWEDDTQKQVKAFLISNRMDKKNIKIFGIAVGALVIIGAAFLVGAQAPKWNLFRESYSVVYLQTGEIYIGKLSTFPQMKLTDSHLLQIKRDPDDAAKVTFQLTPTTETLWAAPILFLNKDQVVFYGQLGPDSKIAQSLR